MEAVLHPPGEFFDFSALTCLSDTERATDLWGFAEMLRTFNEHPSGVAVATFGDRTLLSFGSATLFAGDESEEAHELAWMLEAAEVSEFADDGHGSDFLETFAGHECIDGGFPFPGFQDGFHVFFEAFDPVDAAVDGLEVFFEDDLVSLIGKCEFTEITHVCRCPFGFARVVEAVSKEEGVEALFGTSEIVTSIRSGSADITDGLFFLRQDLLNGFAVM